MTVRIVNSEKKGFFSLLTLLEINHAAPSTDRDQFMNSPFSRHTLDNGLSLIFETIPRINSAAVGFFANTGSRDEVPQQAGVSHFLEHMCFKGTSKRDWRQLSLDIDDLGATWNAYTWWEGTAYFHWVQSERATQSIEILADMMRSTIPVEEFDTEKKVILEEIAMYHDRPDALIFDELIRTAYPEHPLGQSVLGTEDTVGALTRDQMVDYFSRRYAPENMTFIVTGKFDKNEIIASVESLCGDWETGESGRDQPDPAFTGQTRVVERENVTREHITLAFPAPSGANPDATTGEMLSTYLGASTNSRLYWSVVQNGLADEASADYVGLSDTGLIYIYLSVDPARAEEALEVVRNECQALHQEIDADALERAKTRAATSVVCSGEHGLHRFGQLVDDVSCGAPLRSLDQQMDEIRQVDADRIAAYLADFPLDRDPALVALGPLTELAPA